ncbi:MAG TPA: class I SAM-dependent methyltransferase, partial [Planctomycetota bacterium]|nr:class I SAM-dependent methyltransferase [Planctomycetota bacterium]
MIARLWWPWLSWCMGNRWFIDATVLVSVALMAGWESGRHLALSSFSSVQFSTLALSVLLVWYAAGRPGSGLGGVLALALGALTAGSVGAPTAAGLTLVVAVQAALQVPTLIELRTMQHRDDTLRASARGLGVLLPGTAFALPALLLCGGWSLVLAGAVGGFAAMVLPLTWCRLSAEPAPVLPTPLPPRQPHLLVARRMQITVLLLVALGMVDIAIHLRSGNVPLWQLLLPVGMVALWHAVTGRVFQALIVTSVASGWLGYAFLGRESWTFASLLTALALAQPLPLALWFARRGHRHWPGLLLIAMGVVPALAFGEVFAIGGAAMAACLAVVVCTPRPLPQSSRIGLPDADNVLTHARRACQRLTPYWRHYGSAKLRYDPVYRQLAEHTLPWGRVLDAGCGPGLVAALASARGEPSYCGIDLDETKLEAAADLLEQLSQPLGGDWRLLRAKLPLPQVPPTRFDTVLLIDVLHYWPEDDQAAVLRQLHSTLERGGRLILRDGVADAAGDTGAVGLSERLTTFFGLNPGGSGLHFLTEDAMLALLSRCGFSVQSCEASG